MRVFTMMPLREVHIHVTLVLWLTPSWTHGGCGSGHPVQMRQHQWGKSGCLYLVMAESFLETPGDFFSSLNGQNFIMCLSWLKGLNNSLNFFNKIGLFRRAQEWMLHRQLTTSFICTFLHIKKYICILKLCKNINNANSYLWDNYAS